MQCLKILVKILINNNIVDLIFVEESENPVFKATINGHVFTAPKCPPQVRLK